MQELLAHGQRRYPQHDNQKRPRFPKHRTSQVLGGKRDEALMLPAAGSLSLTLDAFPTTTTVEVRDGLAEDTFSFGTGTQQSGDSLSRVVKFLELVRTMAGSSQHAVVTSLNEAPTGAGLASSASGFAALAVAAAAAYGLDLDRSALSRLARRGSGSAARSLVEGHRLFGTRVRRRRHTRSICRAL